MKGDFHVRFRENVKVKFLCVTRLGDSGGQRVGLFRWTFFDTWDSDVKKSKYVTWDNEKKCNFDK